MTEVSRASLSLQHDHKIPFLPSGKQYNLIVVSSFVRAISANPKSIEANSSAPLLVKHYNEHIGNNRLKTHQKNIFGHFPHAKG